MGCWRKAVAGAAIALPGAISAMAGYRPRASQRHCAPKPGSRKGRPLAISNFEDSESRLVDEVPATSHRRRAPLENDREDAQSWDTGRRAGGWQGGQFRFPTAGDPQQRARSRHRPDLRSASRDRERQLPRPVVRAGLCRRTEFWVAGERRDRACLDGRDCELEWKVPYDIRFIAVTKPFSFSEIIPTPRLIGFGLSGRDP